MLTLESYLSGSWVKGTGQAKILVNPANGEPVAETSTEGLDLAGAVAHARNVGGPNLRAMTFTERGAALKAMSKALHEHREELIEASILNAGTPRSDAKFDIDGASGTLAYYASLGKKLGDHTFLVDGEGEQLTRSSRFFGFHLQTPRRGVAVHVNAFNFPAWGLAEKAAVALLAGMPVISKPGTSTALLAYRVMQKIVEANCLPEGALQLLCGGAGDLLTHLGGQDVLAFTGSGTTGTTLRSMENVVSRSVRVNVEADSLNAAVLGTDVQAGSDTYQMFVRDTAKEITQKSGQKCTAVRRIFVPEALVDQVIEDLGEIMATVKIGDPAVEGVRMGPLATARQLKDVRAGIERLVAAGAKVVFGDVDTVNRESGSDAGFFIAPMLLRADSARDVAAVHEHEVFGPVATVMPYRAGESVGELVALGKGGLLSSLYSDDRAFIASTVLELAPFHGRVMVGSKKVADQAIPPGMVLPSCTHGGPGRAGGGEELGGLRGLSFYMQRTAVQGDRALLEKTLNLKRDEA